MKIPALVVGILLAMFVPPVLHQGPASKLIPPGAKIYIAPMPDGFDEFLKPAIAAKKVPIEVVANKEKADFEITGESETQKPSTAKKVIMWDWRSNGQASIQVSTLSSGVVTFAYSVNKISSARPKKSSADACARHLKEKIERKR
ncbi:MAG TPA: hypothetical protein VKB77_14115 [Terriglobales bacterium]|nr:hypothetical protein [Terriglobales bacterium]